MVLVLRDAPITVWLAPVLPFVLFAFLDMLQIQMEYAYLVFQAADSVLRKLMEYVWDVEQDFILMKITNVLFVRLNFVKLVQQLDAVSASQGIP